MHMSLWTEKQMVFSDRNYENENKYFIFLIFMQVLRGFHVSSPKCAFVSDTRKQEDIINGI